MASRNIAEYLFNLGSSQNYCKPIRMFKKMEQLPGYKWEYELLSNPAQIIPPNVWISVDHNNCLSAIKNDVDKSKVTRTGILMSHVQGNCLNRINYQALDDDDIGTIQETQKCFCVSFAVAKNSCDEYLKHVGSELRAFLVPKLNTVHHMNNNGQLDEISKFIYSKFRIFLIFDTIAQPGRVLSIQSCYYPNASFIIEKIIIKCKDLEQAKDGKVKDGGPIFVINEVLSQVKGGVLNNSFGYLSLDSKKKFLMIKKDDPDLSKQNFIGLWVASSYSLKGTKKQFSKEDAIWSALFDFYTNPEIKNRLSIMSKNKGILCYFSISSRSGNRTLKRPQFYLYQIDKKSSSKWNFLTKSQFVTDWSKSLEIKFDFLNNTIMEQKQYSEYSGDQNPGEQALAAKIKNENVNQENYGNKKSGFDAFANKETVSQIYESNVKYPLYQSQEFENSDSKHFKGLNNKDKEIQSLKVELELYKKRCMELEAINRILMQEKLMNPMMFPQYSPYPPQQPPMYSYGQYPPNYTHTSSFYPLSQSQVSPTQMQPPSPRNNQRVKELHQQQFYNIESNTQNLSLKNRKSEEPHSQLPEQKPFIKKKLSQDSPSDKSKTNTKVQKQSEILKNNSESIRDIFIKHDARNISFQDSFAEYHSDPQNEEQNNKEAGENDEVEKNEESQQKQLGNPAESDARIGYQYEKADSINKVRRKELDQMEMKSPQFKRLESLEMDFEKKQVKETKQRQNTDLKPMLNTKCLQFSLADQKKEEKVPSKREKPKKALKQSDSDQSQKNSAQKQKKPQPIRRNNSDDSDDSDDDVNIKNLKMKYSKAKR